MKLKIKVTDDLIFKADRLCVGKLEPKKCPVALALQEQIPDCHDASCAGAWFGIYLKSNIEKRIHIEASKVVREFAWQFDEWAVRHRRSLPPAPFEFELELGAAS